MKNSQLETIRKVEEMRKAFRSMRPTQPGGVLDAQKKANLILLIAGGASRREAAGFVLCAHTTIGRTAARDPDFAAQLAKAEATNHMEAVRMIRHAASDPKYWRAAAWVLERRSPEDYARRDANSFTADQVMSLFAQFYGETLPLVQAGKTEQFQQALDDVLEAIDAKDGQRPCEDDQPDEEKRTHLAPQDALPAARNGNPLAEREEYVGAAGQLAPCAQHGADAPGMIETLRLHQPDQQGEQQAAAAGDRNPLCANRLQPNANDCTTLDKTQGRCNGQKLPA